MLKDIGFWNEQGEYIPDIQEVSEVEMKEYKDCQLCKHLDCDIEGNFVCGLDSVVLDHEGIYCDKFEEFKE